MKLESAISLACEAHRGQVDKGGEPYILHCLRVMLAMRTNEDRIVAVLHDALEDCASGLVSAETVPNWAIPHLESLTRVKGESYEAYIERVATDPVAVNVKLADLKDNMDWSRIPNPTEKDYIREAKYRSAEYRLQNGKWPAADLGEADDLR